MPVPALDPDSSAALVRDWAPRGLASDEVARILSLSQGYPLYLRELALAVESPFTWHEGAAEALIRRPLTELTGEERKAAELIALSEPVRPEVLRHRGDAVRWLVQRGLAVTDERSSLRLAHPLYGEWLRAQLGPMVQDSFAELVSRSDDGVDPVVRLDWTVRAGGQPQADEASSVVKQALGRSDLKSARRFLAYVGGDHDLLAGLVAVAEGDLEGGLTLLDQVRKRASCMGHRVEAAAEMAKHVGITQGDFARSHEILNSTPVGTDHETERHYLLNARLWLCIFGPTDVPGMPGPEELLHVREETPDALAFTLTCAAASVTQQTHGPSGAGPLVERMLEIESGLNVESAPYCQARCVQAWQLYSEDLDAGLQILERAERLALENDWLEGRLLVAGNIAWVAAVRGHVGQAIEAVHKVLPAMGAMNAMSSDVFQYLSILSAAHRGNLSLTDDQSLSGLSEGPPTRRAPHDVVRVLEARAEALIAEAQGRPAPPLETFRGVGEHGKRPWLELLYLDVCDLRVAPGVHEYIADCLPRAFLLSFPAGHDLARARLTTDPLGIFDCAVRLLEVGVLTGATRALADVTRLVDESDPLHLAARRHLAHARTVWDGAPMPWLQDVARLPTQRQLDIAVRIAGGESIRDVADQQYLSQRTVENHLYRACRMLGASSRSDLTWLIRPR